MGDGTEGAWMLGIWSFAQRWGVDRFFARGGKGSTEQESGSEVTPVFHEAREEGWRVLRMLSSVPRRLRSLACGDALARLKPCPSGFGMDQVVGPVRGEVQVVIASVWDGLRSSEAMEVLQEGVAI